MVAGQGALKSGSLHGRAVEFPDACAAGRTVAHWVPSQIRAVEFPGACAAGYTWWPELRWINPLQAAEFSGACEAGHT